MKNLNVIIGNFEDPLNGLLSTTIEKVIKGEFRLNVASFLYVEDIEDYARMYPIDLFVIVVNNVTIRHENPSSSQRIEEAYTRQNFGCPFPKSWKGGQGPSVSFSYRKLY